MAKDPENPRTFDQLGRLCFDQGEFGESERNYLRAIELVEMDPRRLTHILDPLSNWGKRLVALGRVAEGAAMLERSMELFPGLPYACGHLAWLRKIEGKTEEALKLCDRSIARAPGRCRAHRERGLILWMAGDRQAAVESLREAVRLNPSDEESLVCLTWAHEALGRFRDSLELCVESLEVDPDQSWAHRSLVRLQHRLDGDRANAPLWDRAARALSDRTKLADLSPAGTAALVVARLRGSIERDVDRALSLASESSARHDDPHLQAALAAVLFAAGRRLEAVGALEDAERMARVPAFVAEQLTAYRQQSLPDLASFETADCVLEWSGSEPGELLRRLRQSAPGPDGERRRGVEDYLEARILQEDDRHLEAAEKFRSLRETVEGPPRVRLTLRLAQCLDHASQSAEAAAVLRNALPRAPQERHLLEQWFHLCADELHLPLAELLEALPRGRPREAPPAKEDRTLAMESGAALRALLETLRRGEPFRIDCGGTGLVDSKGNRWNSDRFHDGGTTRTTRYATVRSSADARLFRTARVFPAGELHAAYRIPLPRGRYLVELHVAETDPRGRFPRRFNVELAGDRVLESVGVSAFASAEKFAFEAEVQDGILEIRFEPVSGDPAVSALVVSQMN